MVLSNAERQKRYRERLKAAARGADLVKQAREAIEAAVAACWELGRRENTEMQDYASPAEIIAEAQDPKFQKHNGPTVAYLETLFRSYIEGDGPTDEERETIARARALIDAVSLRDARAD